MKNQGSGDINYSFNKKEYFKVLNKNINNFYAYYVVAAIICFKFISDISMNKFINYDESNQARTDFKIKNYFSSIVYSSPFDILKLNNDIKKNPILNNPDHFIGLSQNSYILIIFSYVFAFLIIIESLVKNLLASILVNYIQINKNNNPYNNSECITKIKKNPFTYINKNYSTIMTQCLYFLIPYILPLILRFLDFDKYDLKKSWYLKYLVFISIFIPVVLVLINRIVSLFYKDNLDDVDKFIQNKDTRYINFLRQMFNLKFLIIFSFLFIFISFILFHWVYGEYNTVVSKKYRFYFYIVLVLLLFLGVPYILENCALSSLYNVFDKTDLKENIDNIEKEGVNSLYELIVKYNYPCFKK